MFDQELLLKLIKKEEVTRDELANELYEICDRTHAQCDTNCPIYRLYDGKVPEDDKMGKIFGCNYFKDGHKMLAFIESQTLTKLGFKVS